MRIHFEKIETESSEPIKTQEFGIREQDMSMILEILRSKLYANPIGAICREYSCNARDANRESGKESTPIEITLPTIFSKQIEIKDSGLGISPKRVHDIFLNYGASTKRDTNKYCGAFGLGSKSGFSYSQSFSVVTTHGGKTRHYTAVIDESRRGKMDLQAEHSSTDPTGTTIIIPVKESDFQEFARATIAQTQHWDSAKGTGPRPIIRNLPAGIQYAPVKAPMLSGEDWDLLSVDNDRYNNSHSSRIVIDGIAYELKREDIGIDYRDSSYNWLVSMLGKEIIFHFPIGKLSLAANRDTIHFDEATKALIIKKLGVVYDALVKSSYEKIAACSFLDEAEIFWGKFSTNFSWKDGIKNADIPIWKGIPLIGCVRVKNDTDQISIRHYHYTYGRRSHAHKTVCTPVESVNIVNDIYINDLDIEKGIMTRVHPFLDKIGIKGKAITLIKFGDKVTEKRWLEDQGLQHMRLHYLSALPKPEKVSTRDPYAPKRARGPKRIDIDAWKINISGYQHSWDPTVISKTDTVGGIYIECISKREGKYISGKMDKLPHNLSSVVTLFGQKIYLIKSSQIKYLPSTWKTFESVIYSTLKTKLDGFDSNYADTIIQKGYNRDAHTGINKSLIVDKGGIYLQWLEAKEQFAKEFNEQKEIRDIYRALGYLINRTDTLDGEVKKKKKVYDGPFFDLESRVIKYYPLLWTSRDARVEDLADYINLIDERQSKDSTETATKIRLAV